MTLYITPYRRMAALRNAMDRLFEENFTEPVEREMLLAVDVRANDDDYSITALVPGLQAEDVNVEILNNTVTLQGEFKSPAASDDAKFLVCELPAGKFSRVITLPTALDAAKAQASIKDGVLVLRIPKAEAHRPKAIKVQTA